MPEPNPGAAAVLDWRPHVPEDMKADPVFAPMIEKATEKTVPDIIKGYFHAQKRLGSAFNLPGPNATPEEREAATARLVEAGFVKPGPKDAAAYGTLRPEALPEGFAWDDKLEGDFKGTLLKHGASPELAKDLMALYSRTLGGASEMFRASKEEGYAKLRAEFGSSYEERAALAGRLAEQVFKSPEEIALFEKTGLANHPLFMSVMFRLAPYAQADSSFLPETAGDSGATGEDARTELSQIMGDANHPKHKLYMAKDPKTLEYVNGLYKKAYGDKQVAL